MRHIWLKKLLVWLLTPLRLTDRTLLLSFGFRQNLQLTRSIIEYEDPRGASDAKMATERVIDLAKKWRLNSWNTRTGVYYVLDDVANSTTDEWAAACRTLLDEGWLQDRPGHKFVLQRARSGWGGIFLRQMADRRTAYF